jgi:alcohol dehydrogenase class IV
LLSGITLAQVGLGVVHGLAAPLGALFPIAHGVACGATVAAATDINIRALEQRQPDSPALKKYARVGRLFIGKKHIDDSGARAFLVHILQEWTTRLAIPGLAAHGVRECDFPGLVARCRGNSMKTNPLILNDGEVGEILARCL